MSQVICLGEILIDRIANEPGSDINLIQNWTNYPGGAPANVACALSRLGTSSAFLGCIGADQFGNELLATLKKYKVNLELVQRHPTATTRQVFVTRDENGDRRFAGFGQSPSIFADTQLSFQTSQIAVFESAQFLYLGSLIFAENSSRNTVDQYLQLAQSKSIQIFMDVNLRPMFWDQVDQSKSIILDHLKQIDYLKVSDDEAYWLFNAQSPVEIYDQYPNLQGIFLTRGAQGCAYLIQDFAGSLPGFQVNVTDTTGAGDGFVAGCLHQLVKQPPIQNSTQAKHFVQYANAVGALTTQQQGAIAPQPTHHSVENFLQKINQRDSNSHSTKT